MANTRDVMGDQACLEAIVSGTLTSLVDDEVYSVAPSALQYMSHLEHVSLPNCESVGEWAFTDCPRLTTALLPECKTLSTYAFYNDAALATISLQKCEIVYSHALEGTALTEVTLPECTSVGGYAFRSCQNLATATLPKCAHIGPGAFQSCGALTSVIIGASSVCHVDTGSYPLPTQFDEGGAGTVYVPADLVASYKADALWKDYNIAAIEG